MERRGCPPFLPHARCTRRWGGRVFVSGGGGGVDRALWLDLSPKRTGQDPQNRTETDPRASEVTQIQKSEKK